MKNTTLIKLRLNKASRNLKDYLKVTYFTGVIGDENQRYISIWEDYRIAYESLLRINKSVFDTLDKPKFPDLIQGESYPNREKYFGYSSQSRDIIKAAIDNALEYIEKYELANPDLMKNSDEVTESSALIIRLMNNWSNMISSFKHHRTNVQEIRISNEYEMQYLLEGVLRLFFDDVRPETYTQNYANKSNRTDFLLPKERILIETKMTRPGLDDRKLLEELIIDKEFYRKEPNIDIILCLVYDPERRIKNPEGLKDMQELVSPPYFSVHLSH